MIKKVSIREFNRNMYHYLDKLPIIVENLKTGEEIFIVKKYKRNKGGELDEIRTKNSSKQKR